jgi:hypothetical protein
MTLLVGLLLLIGAGILTFSTARTGVIEQRIANNEFRAKEAQQAAQAGLEYALAWLAQHLWTTGDAEPTPPTISASTGYRYQTQLTFSKKLNGICVQAQSTATTDPDILANVWECFNQTGLFDATTATTMPAPWVLAGCLTAPIGIAEIYVAKASASAAMTGGGANATCLPQGSVSISTWNDRNANRIMEPSEEEASSAFNRAAFSGCPGALCAWNQVFDMTLEDASAAATASHHVYASNIPCGASAPPGIYRLQTGGPIDAVDLTGSCPDEGVDDNTIGTPDHPILLIVPSASGCPSFNAGIDIYGIVYYESATACVTQSWGGARMHGSVIWEGDVNAPMANARFIATDFGTRSALNDSFQVVRSATRIPGTWHDWE